MSLLLPGVAGAKSFQPLYEKASKSIREVDDNTIIFWEPALYSYFLPINGDETMEQILVDFMSSFTLVSLSTTNFYDCSKGLDLRPP